jgi:hypothetical protein
MNVTQEKVLQHIGTLYTLNEDNVEKLALEQIRAGKLFDLLFQVASGVIKPQQIWCNVSKGTFEVREPDPICEDSTCDCKAPCEYPQESIGGI